VVERRAIVGRSCRQPLERGQAGLGRVGRQHPVVGAEAPEQSRLDRGAGRWIGVHDDHGGETGRGPIGYAGPAGRVGRHGAFGHARRASW
jgi:hypothetical protein